MNKPIICSTPPGSGEAGFVIHADAFQRIMDRERMRADRCERPFSVLVFTASSPRSSGHEFAELGGYLGSRLRATDVVGQLDSRRLAILLFDTDRTGAKTLLDDISEHGPQGPCPAIHSYAPTDSTADVTTQPAAVATPDILFVRPIPAWKRTADVVLSVTSLIVFAPIMAMAAILIKVTSPGPVLFCQRRAGLAGRPFLVYKFRTMRLGADEQKSALRPHSEQDGPAFKLKDDPRVTPLGRYLRKTCIDEFPQFWNVLRGEMSIVGPRPLPLDESADCRNWQRRRLDVTPGMTCTWQVSGGLRVSFIEWMRMDLRYIRHRTLWHDFKLLVKTAQAILFHRASH